MGQRIAGSGRRVWVLYASPEHCASNRLKATTTSKCRAGRTEGADMVEGKNMAWGGGRLGAEWEGEEMEWPLLFNHISHSLPPPLFHRPLTCHPW
jgi:hypothetical protein